MIVSFLFDNRRKPGEAAHVDPRRNVVDHEIVAAAVEIRVVIVGVDDLDRHRLGLFVAVTVVNAAGEYGHTAGEKYGGENRFQ
ncbi:hypothetical protein SDC9_198310 [bioreactor metagenome]|uniref:Uncharacterized protein n=1 Tax=bioreactor metagenome TaxID=1076179 RepID=A0A645IHA8_9ZZZZ